MEKIFPRQGFVKMKEVSTGKTIVLQPGQRQEISLQPLGYRIYTVESTARR
jgi:hypothetical protein